MEKLATADNSIKVSVIVPVYNVEQYLRECMDSILAQTLREIEIICVDDGSTDGSLAILQEYAAKDERVQILTQANAGAGAARNKGLAVARGEYLSFLDGDDFFDKRMLAIAYAKARKAAADIAIYKNRKYDNSTGKYSKTKYQFEKYVPKRSFTYKDISKYIFNIFYNWTWNKLFRREFIESNNIKFQEVFRTNDLFFTCVAFVQAKSIVFINKVLMSYRVGIRSSQTTNDEHPLDFLKAFDALQYHLVSCGVYEAVKQSYINWLLSGCMANLHSQEGKDGYKLVYSAIKEVLSQNSINNCGISYFYDLNHYYSMQNLLGGNIAEVKFESDKTHRIVNCLFFKIRRRIYV
ncbi:MAG: glycosyltransferase [Deferribacteraceae bacterium]|nr:glycosyltransferase [Deferribacteraceae bacterium]